MPPKPKFTREEIIAAALKMARQHGISSITAVALGEALGSSARPIFTAFSNMKDVHDETIKAAKVIYNEYVEKGLTQKPAFKGVGMSYIRFAKEEPKLFQLLFMTGTHTPPELSFVLAELDENCSLILKCIQAEYGLSEEKAYKLYRLLWLYTHGIATLYATNVCQFTENETSEILTEVFVALLKDIKSQT